MLLPAVGWVKTGVEFEALLSIVSMLVRGLVPASTVDLGGVLDAIDVAGLVISPLAISVVGVPVDNFH